MSNATSSPSTPTPTVGRDVHHVAHGSADGQYVPEIRPAKVTKVISEELVNLVVWTDMGQFWPKSAQYHGGDPATEPPFSPFYRCPHTGLAYPGGTWHWPPRL